MGFAREGHTCWKCPAKAQLVGTTPELLTNGRRKGVCSLSCVPRKPRRSPPRYSGHKRRSLLFESVSRVEPWSVLLRLTPDTLRGEAFCLAPNKDCLP